MSVARSATPGRIHVGDRLICRFSDNAPPLVRFRTYTVDHVLTLHTGRLIELVEHPGQTFPAWRFMAEDSKPPRKA